MKTLKQLQREIYQNKVDKGFNVTDMELEFRLTQGELEEAHEAWRAQDGTVGEELADVMIYVLGMAQILGIDMQQELEHKVDKNRRRKYALIDGVMRRVEEAD